MTKALLLSADALQYRQLLGSVSTPWDLTTVETVDQALLFCAETEVLLGDPNLLLLLVGRMPKLRWIQSSWAGVAPLVDALQKQPQPGLTLTNIRGIFGPLMVEYVFAYLLGHERQLQAHWQSQRQRLWRGQRCGSLQAKTLGLLGLGSIGQDLAKAARLFGMQVVGCSRTAPAAGLVDRHYSSAQLIELVAQVDYLVCTLPSTPQTQNLLGQSVFARMKPTALLINAGRGDLIEDAALVDALVQGQIAGAVLDVFRQEPLPQGHPFWTAPNLVITSHTAAPSYPAYIAPIFIENMQRFEQGLPLRFEVDLQRGY